MQADLLTQVILPIALFFIMLGMGLSLKLADFTQVFQFPKAVILGLSAQLLCLPLLGVLVVFLLGLQAELAVGLIILTLCPGGSTSNMISYLAKGDVALSITLTAFVSLITPFTIPLFTLMAIKTFIGEAQVFDLPLMKTIVQLIVITLIPVLIGMTIHSKKPEFSKKAEKPVKILSLVFLFIIIAGIVIKNKNNMLGYFVDTGLATLLLNILAMAFGYGVAHLFKLSHPQAVTLGIEVGIQNGTVALLVAGTLLANPLMTIPAVTYSLLMFVTGAVFSCLVNRTSGNANL